MKVLVVGSGLVGATWARLLLDGLPDATVLMVDAGPVLTDPPGLNVRNIPDPAARAEARRQAVAHLVGDDPEARADVPAAAVVRCVGGQGAGWTGATVRPYGSERIPFIPDDEWDQAIAAAEGLLHTNHHAFVDSIAGKAVRAALSDAFDDTLRSGRGAGPLPVACDIAVDGSVTWAGTDTILAPILYDDRFELRAETMCRQVHAHDITGRYSLRPTSAVTGATLRNQQSGEQYTVDADLVVVAAGAVHTPQLLWASGIRPEALGRYLTEHPTVSGIVALRPELFASSDVLPWPGPTATVTVPFSAEHPFHAEVTASPTSPVPPRDSPYGFAALQWACRTFPREVDGLEFAEAGVDENGMPAVRFQYCLTRVERAEIDRALREQARAAAVLGPFVAGGEPRLLPAGSSLHFQGTFRMGAKDDGESVCDSYSRVWGHRRLVLGGAGLIPTATACDPTLTSVALAVRGARAAIAEFAARP